VIMSDQLPTHTEDDVVLFEAAGERFALPAAQVMEIVRPPAITRVPNSPPNLLGVANLRGRVLPVVSVGGLLGHAHAEISRATRVVVVAGDSPVGLVVDTVLTIGKGSDGRRLELGTLFDEGFRLQRRAAVPRLATGVGDTETATETVSEELVFLVFDVAKQEYALPLDVVTGVSRIPGAVANFPRTDAAMFGFSEVNGYLIPLVSARILLGFEDSRISTQAERIVITRLGNHPVGLLVDSMRDIIRVTPNELDDVPPVLTRAKGEAQVEAICRLEDGGRLISILSPSKLFDAGTAARIEAEADQGVQQMQTETAVQAGEQLIVFQLDQESYGIPIGSIDEVVRCPDNLTRVPRAPAFVKGLMNLRGKAIPIIDQRQRFSVKGDGRAARPRILVVTIDGLQTGFLVDSVSEVMSVAAGELSAAPDLSYSDEGVGVIDRIAAIERDGRMILVVDPRALLDRAERDVLETIRKQAEDEQPS
jgi:purine-binding chemotaxis protein CheW